MIMYLFIYLIIYDVTEIMKFHYCFASQSVSQSVYCVMDIKFHLIKINIFNFSARRHHLLLLSIKLMSLNKLSEGIELGGADRYFLAITANIALYFFSSTQRGS